jgi:hypothetical protein
MRKKNSETMIKLRNVFELQFKWLFQKLRIELRLLFQVIHLEFFNLINNY